MRSLSDRIQQSINSILSNSNACLVFHCIHLLHDLVWAFLVWFGSAYFMRSTNFPLFQPWFCQAKHSFYSKQFHWDIKVKAYSHCSIQWICCPMRFGVADAVVLATTRISETWTNSIKAKLRSSTNQTKQATKVTHHHRHETRHSGRAYTSSSS